MVAAWLPDGSPTGCLRVLARLAVQFAPEVPGFASERTGIEGALNMCLLDSDEGCGSICESCF